MRLRTEIEESLGRFRAWLAGLPDRGRTARLVVGLVLYLFAFGVLVALNVLLRAGGLWGDLLFALVVLTAVLWLLTRATTPLLGRKKSFRAFPRAASAALFGLVGLPVAVVTWPVGAVLLLLPVLAWIGLALAQGLGRRTVPLPPLWAAALVGLGMLFLFLVLRQPLTREDRVPRAVPPGALDETYAELAARFRPLLFFDSAEQRYPLDIEEAIAEGRIDMCRGALSRDACVDVGSPAEIDDGYDYLEVSDAPAPRRGGDSGSAYYYHVVRRGERVYVDYWWFYARNPSPVAGEVFCGPGLRTPPFTCQEHAGDWEGVTVELAPCAEPSDTCADLGGELLGPAAVRYAQHEHVVAHAWEELEERWLSLPRPASAALGPVWEASVLPAAADPGARPLVFVARNSHASYPRACFGGCRQSTRDLPEGRFDGGQPWTHNEGECDGCLKPLPVTAAGAPALWNAFTGRWGAQRCILGGAYCDLSGAPRGPALQGRYRDPGGEDA